MAENLIPFAKYSGNGNDFIIIDKPHFDLSGIRIQELCDRHFGIGADGILVLGDAPGADGSMRIFNADGLEAEMCGNGLRCLATYIDDRALVKKNKYVIKTMNGTYPVERKGKSFAIEMSEIREQGLYDLSPFKGFAQSFYINTGVPHVVFLGKDIKKLDLKKIAPEYRYHKMFPNGTNVNLVEVLDEKAQTAYVRTYERGVEDETHSCGTGLTATGLALSSWLGWKGDITLLNLGGRQTVSVGGKVVYSGEVVHCFSGHFKL